MSFYLPGFDKKIKGGGGPSVSVSKCSVLLFAINNAELSQMKRNR